MAVKLKEVLKREFRSRNESIATIAAACKMPVATLHGWMHGTLPSAKNIHYLKSLSEYLEIPIATLLFNVKDDSSKGAILFSSEFIDAERRYRLTVEKLPK